MLGNHEVQGDMQDKVSCHLEPDQEVAAVLGTGGLSGVGNLNHVAIDRQMLRLPPQKITTRFLDYLTFWLSNFIFSC